MCVCIVQAEARPLVLERVLVSGIPIYDEMYVHDDSADGGAGRDIPQPVFRPYIELLQSGEVVFSTHTQTTKKQQKNKKSSFGAKTHTHTESESKQHSNDLSARSQDSDSSMHTPTQDEANMPKGYFVNDGSVSLQCRQPIKGVRVCVCACVCACVCVILTQWGVNIIGSTQ